MSLKTLLKEFIPERRTPLLDYLIEGVQRFKTGVERIKSGIDYSPSLGISAIVPRDGGKVYECIELKNPAKVIRAIAREKKLTIVTGDSKKTQSLLPEALVLTITDDFITKNDNGGFGSSANKRTVYHDRYIKLYDNPFSFNPETEEIAQIFFSAISDGDGKILDDAKEILSNITFVNFCRNTSNALEILNALSGKIEVAEEGGSKRLLSESIVMFQFSPMIIRRQNNDVVQTIYVHSSNDLGSYQLQKNTSRLLQNATTSLTDGVMASDLPVYLDVTDRSFSPLFINKVDTSDGYPNKIDVHSIDFYIHRLKNCYPEIYNYLVKTTDAKFETQDAKGEYISKNFNIPEPQIVSLDVTGKQKTLEI